MSVKPTSEELMAYADGQLDSEHARRIEGLIALHPELRAEIEDHRRTRAVAREAFEAMAAAPMSPDLATFNASLNAAPRQGWRGKKGRPVAIFGWPAAAAACLAAGFATGTLALASNDGLVRWQDGPFAGTQLARALETSPSGAAVDNTLVVATFEASDGLHCRQFELGGGAADGVACRKDAGWSILALAVRPGGPDGYQAAGGGDPVALAVAALKPGPRLAEEAERDLIAKGWKN